MSKIRDAARQARNRIVGRGPTLAERMVEVERRVSNQHNRIQRTEQRVSKWSPAVTNVRVNLEVLNNQVASLEERLAGLSAPVVAPGDDAARAEARDLVQAIQEEHARVRARLTLMANYEERLRRVEVAVIEALTLLPDPPLEPAAE
jgi:outer membrane murein-binding lipoprotein Lpp